MHDGRCIVFLCCGTVCTAQCLLSVSKVLSANDDVVTASFPDIARSWPRVASMHTLCGACNCVYIYCVYTITRTIQFLVFVAKNPVIERLKHRYIVKCFVRNGETFSDTNIYL